VAGGRRALLSHAAPHEGQGPAIGRWETLSRGAELIGRLEGDATQSYEVPRGVLADGERVELWPTGAATPPARGPIARPRRAAAPRALQPDEVRRLAPTGGGPLDATRRRLREWRSSCLLRLEAIEDPLARGLAAALLFGERAQLPPGLGDLFTRTGTRHALAVSGLHVGLVAALWIWPLGAGAAWLVGRLGGRRRRAGRLAEPAVWRALLLALFVPLAGAGAPVLRAALALALAQLAGLVPRRGGSPFGRRPDPLSLWASAAAIEWLADPEALRSLSLQLSYVATLGLVLITPRLGAWTRGRWPIVAEVDGLGRRRSPLLRIVATRALRGVRLSLAASAAASVATLPIVWGTFGEWSVAGPLATLALLPLLALFLGLAWLWVLIPLDALESLLGGLSRAMVGLLEGFDGWPGTPVPLPERPEVLLLAAGLLVLIAAARRDRLGAVAARGSCVLWGVLLVPWCSGPRGLELHALDVGHGTAVVLRAPGAGTWLFDAGSRDRRGVAREAVAPLLRALDVGQVRIALSHGESDHAGALPWLIERYPPRLWLGALPARLDARLPHDCPRVDLETGRSTIKGGANGELELTLVRGLTEDGNEGSRSLEVAWRGRRLLLCGDAEAGGLARQLRSGDLRGPYEITLFPHHGSETDWLAAFLRATLPGTVWFSAGERPPVLDELERRGVPWRSTHAEGPLRLDWVGSG